MRIYLSLSDKPNKKYKVLVQGKTIHFGGAGYSDYTKHKDKERKRRYIGRHQSRENWNKSGITTAGFWSRWLLWFKPTLKESIQATERKFNIVLVRCPF